MKQNLVNSERRQRNKAPEEKKKEKEKKQKTLRLVKVNILTQFTMRKKSKKNSDD